MGGDGDRRVDGQNGGAGGGAVDDVANDDVVAARVGSLSGARVSRAGAACYGDAILSPLVGERSGARRGDGEGGETAGVNGEAYGLGGDVDRRVD